MTEEVGVRRAPAHGPACVWLFNGVVWGYNQIGRSWSEMTLKQSHFLDRCMVAAILMLCAYLIVSIFSRVTLP